MKKYYILLASLILAVFGLAQLGEAQSAAPLTVTEVDGSPTRTGIRKLIFSNGSVSISGQTATVTTGGGGGGSVNVNGSSVSSPNFNGTTPAAPAGGINTTWQVSGSSVSGYTDVGSLGAAYVRKPVIIAEFWSTQDTFNGGLGANAISSGTTTSGAANGNHPGVASISSSTSTNSGYAFRSSGDRFLIGGGEQLNIIFKTPADLTGTTLRFGFHDSTTSADAIDGVYFELPSTGQIVGKTSNNSTRTTSSTIATLVVDTWYHAVIAVNSGATQVDYTVYSDAGASLGSQSITTNIPTSAGRETGIAFLGTNSGTTAVILAHVDAVIASWTKALTRGQ